MSINGRFIGTRGAVPHKGHQAATAQGFDPRWGAQTRSFEPRIRLFVGRTWGCWGKPWLTFHGAHPMTVRLREQASEIACPARACPATGKSGTLSLAPSCRLPALNGQPRRRTLTSWLRSSHFTRQPGHHPPCVHISNSWPLGFFSNLARKVWRRYGDAPSGGPDVLW